MLWLGPIVEVFKERPQVTFTTLRGAVRAGTAPCPASAVTPAIGFNVRDHP
jgi:hypothetical protein